VALGFAVIYTIVQIFGPFVVQLTTRGELRRLRDVLRMTTRWALSISAPIILLLPLVGEPVLKLLGQEASLAHVALPILAAALLLQAGTGPVGHVLTMSGRATVNLVDNGIALVLNVGLNLILIPRFGVTGAALAWALAIGVTNCLRVIQVYKIYSMVPFDVGLVKPALAMVVSGTSALIVRGAVSVVVPRASVASVLIVAVWVVASFFGMLFALGLTEADRSLVHTFIERGGLDRAPDPSSSGRPMSNVGGPA